MKKFAYFISRIFDPFWVLGVLAIIVSLRSGLAGVNLERFLLLLTTVIIGLPAGLLIWAVKTKRVGNIDVSSRRQRVKVLGIFLLMLSVDLLLVKFFGNQTLFNLFIFFSIWFLGFFLITLFWKISGHMAALTLSILLIIRWYGLAWLPLIFLLPLLAWARIASKNHSLKQVIAGIIYSVFIFLFIG